MELGNDTHIWLASLDLGEPDVASLGVLLAPAERQRASRFRFDRDRRHFIVARGLLRQLLARYAGDTPAQIEFCYGPQGKPALAGRDDLQFSVAHSHGAGLFAFTRGALIGVDAEQIRPLEHDALAASFFSAVERAALTAVPVERRQDAFFTLAFIGRREMVRVSLDGDAEALSITRLEGSRWRRRRARSAMELVMICF